MKKLIIGAPFGNYFDWPNATSTLGTFTREFRGGPWKRLWRMIRTLRYYPGIKAWKNKLGLPNPGIDSLESKNVSDKIVSISARNTHDWVYLIQRTAGMNPLAIELNVSCPNCPYEEDTSKYTVVYECASHMECEIIVKLPPVNYESHLDRALSQGIRSFHCCNTLPTPGGGMSGKPLKLLSMRCSYEVSTKDSNRIIGGGGITHEVDTKDYKMVGATNYSVASVLINPLNWLRIRRLSDDLG